MTRRDFLDKSHRLFNLCTDPEEEEELSFLRLAYSIGDRQTMLQSFNWFQAAGNEQLSYEASLLLDEWVKTHTEFGGAS